MNIMFLDSIDVGTYGGMEEWIRLVAHGLAGRGNRVTLAGRRGSEYLRRAGGDGSAVSRVELDISGDFSPSTIATLGRYIADNDVNIIVVNFNKDVRLGGVAARLQGDCRVVWSIGLDITRDSMIHRWLTPKLIDSVLVPSSSLKEQITRHEYIEHDKVTVIPIGIADTDLASISASVDGVCRRHNLPSSSPVILTSGRLVEQKGHIHLVDAAPMVLEQFPDCRFLWLGDGPLRFELLSKIDRLGVTSAFALAGMVDDVAPFLAAADLMVHPSIEEPFGIALVEGMRASLPIVASRVGGIPEVVDENNTALLVEPGNSQEMADAIISLLSDRIRMQAMGKSARSRWEREFQLDSMIDRISAYCNSLLGTESCRGTA
ncbi:MAG: glycosyltransferase family 4 protein [Candidatus Zixiibacteriota bacterium]